MKKVLLLVLLVGALPAFATDKTPPTRGDLIQNQFQQQAQIAVGAGGSASAASTFQYDGDRNPVNSAFGYAPPPTADCQATIGTGGQGVNIGLSFSASYDDSECNRRAWAAFLVSVKREKAAMEVVCQSKYVKDTTYCKTPTK